MAQEHTIANFLTANLNGAFPLDTEGLAALQGNLALLHALGRMSGCACVLSGCANKGDAGLVFWYDPQRNNDFPDGEVLPVVSGSRSDTLYLVEKPVSVTVAGQTIMNAYTERHLEWGTGRVTLNYADFRHLDTNSMTLQGLHDRVASVEATLPSLLPLPVGSVIMYAGTQRPNNNYLVCDGTSYFVEDYPDLAAVLAGIYQDPTPEAGKFRVPDFRSRMPVGLDTAHTLATNLFDTLGNRGGEVEHQLTPDEMPTHRHDITGQYMHKNGTSTTTVVALDSSEDPSHGDNKTYDNKIGYAGGDAPHNNMPPYMTINYIIRAK